MWQRRPTREMPSNPAAVMGTPLPDSSESDIDVNLPFSEVLSSQPARTFSRAGSEFNLNAGQGHFPQRFHPAPVPFPPSRQFYSPIPSNYHPSMFLAPSHQAAPGPTGSIPAARTYIPEEFQNMNTIGDTSEAELIVMNGAGTSSQVPAENGAGTSSLAGTEDDDVEVILMRGRRSSSQTTAIGKRKRNSTPKETSRLNWEPEWVGHLLELKRAESQESESLSGRDVIMTAEQKWKKIQAGLAVKGVFDSVTQIRWKWDSLLAKYKQVKLYNKHTGVASFETLSKAQRREEKLPHDFDPQWFEVMDSFYGSMPQVDPPCVADSSDPFAGLEVPQTPEDETDITDRDTEDGSASKSRSNSGVRSKNVPKVSQTINDCMGKFTGTLLEVEKSREERESRRFTFLETVETKKVELDERRITVEERRIDIEDRKATADAARAKELVGALTSVAASISQLCAQKAKSQEQS